MCSDVAFYTNQIRRTNKQTNKRIWYTCQLWDDNKFSSSPCMEAALNWWLFETFVSGASQKQKQKNNLDSISNYMLVLCDFGLFMWSLWAIAKANVVQIYLYKCKHMCVRASLFPLWRISLDIVMKFFIIFFLPWNWFYYLLWKNNIQTEEQKMLIAAEQQTTAIRLLCNKKKCINFANGKELCIAHEHIYVK